MKLREISQNQDAANDDHQQPTKKSKCHNR